MRIVVDEALKLAILRIRELGAIDKIDAVDDDFVLQTRDAARYNFERARRSLSNEPDGRRTH